MTQPASGLFDPPGVAWTAVSAKLIRARLIVAGVWIGVPLVLTVVLAVAVRVAWVWAFPGFFALLALWVGWLIPRQVRAIGYAERDDDLLIRRGIMFRSLTVVPYGRMQYLDVTRGPIARRLGIASLQLHTASASTDASIPGLESDEGERLRDQLTRRGEARRAGL